jgi:hypothetical protein
MKRKKVNIVLLIGIVMSMVVCIVGIISIIYWKNRAQIIDIAAIKIKDKLSYITIPIAVNEFEENDFNIYVSGHAEYSTLASIGSELLVFLPVSYRTFLDEGGLVVVSSNFIQDAKEFYGEEITDETQGFYKKSGDIPTIWINTDYFEDNKGDSVDVALAKYFNSINFTYHEIAHYLDEKYSISSRTEFLDYYKRYAKEYKERTVSAGYAATNEKEFFAVLFSEMFSWSSDILDIPDDLFEFMQSVFQETEHINIERNEAAISADRENNN